MMDNMEMVDMEYDFSQPLVGGPAPDFEGVAYLKGWEGGKDGANTMGMKPAKLSDYEGKWLVLFFYPLSFTGVCTTEINAFSDALSEFQARGAEVLGASIDSQFVHKAWVDSGQVGDLKFPLLADLDHTIAADYGILTDKGFALRGLFIINPEGMLLYNVVHNTDVGRSVDETLRVLDALQSGGACPANWKKGDKNL
jgi:peroxiredoxin (alkyl hydroperoxide reductase subunit C)